MIHPAHPVIPSKKTILSGLLLFCLHPVLANPAKPFEEGNRAYEEGRYDAAIESYLAALELAPESAEILYNLGNAKYRAGEYEEGVEIFEVAAAMARTDELHNRCRYNMGNCMVGMGESLHEADPQAAIRLFHQAAWAYRAALEYGSGFPDAVYNLEIAQHRIAAIEKKVREREEKEKQENELIKYIREKLMEFIERQSRLIEAHMLSILQANLERDVRALAVVIEESGLHADFVLPEGSAMSGPLKETFTHTVEAADAMAVPDQATALAELKAALEAVPEDKDRQDGTDEDSEDFDESDMDYADWGEEGDMYEDADPFGDFSEYEEIRGVPPPNQTEMDILAEEIRNQEQRKQKRAGAYKPVEKDW